MAKMKTTPEEEQDVAETTQRILQELPQHRGNLIPILQRIQERLGYLPRSAMAQVAQSLHLPPIDVYSVATFYNQFRLSPPGKHRVKVCLGTACHMKGGHIILEAWQRRLGINVGQTTPDRQFSLDRVACVGCCAMAPVSIVNEAVEGRVSPTRVDGILLGFGLEKGQKTPKEGTDES